MTPAYLFGVTGVLALAVIGVIGPGRRAIYALIALVVVVLVGVYLWAYLSASNTPNNSDCDGCGQHFGRYWDPTYTVLWALVGFAGLVIGASVGMLGRFAMHGLKKAPPR